LPYAEGQSGNPAGRIKGAPEKPKNLIDLEWVYANPTKETDDPNRKKLQQQWAEDHPKFTARLEKAQEKWFSVKANLTPKAGKTVDVGSDRIEELIQGLLKDMDVLAACPA
jgi:hypothetical protein